MMNKGLAKYGLRALDRLTDRFPVIVPRVFQHVFLAIAGHRLVGKFYLRRYARTLRHAGPIQKLLVIVDVNIGDAVIMQSTVRALNECYPEAVIDYACNSAGGTLLTGMPGIRRLHNIFTQFASPSERDLNTLREIIQGESYNVIFNLCPFIHRKDLRTTISVIPLYVLLSAEIIRGWSGHRGKIHLTHVAASILYPLIAASAKSAVEHRSLPEQSRPGDASGSSIYLSHEAVMEARAFLVERGLDRARHLLLFHADAPFRYTRLPLPLQRRLLERILRAEEIDYVLFSCGNSRDGLDRHVLAGLSEQLLAKVIRVPLLSIGAYAAIIDACDMFLSGDTGPMHIAAAFKIPMDARDVTRNRTALVAVYGATDTRMSSYDSSLVDHVHGWQQAPAKVFNAPAPCRNISCVDKPGKTCTVVRCFDGLLVEDIAEYIISYIHHIRTRVHAIHAHRIDH